MSQRDAKTLVGLTAFAICMNEPNAILFKKRGLGAEIINSITEWNIACTLFPFAVGGEAKSLTSRDYTEEDGEDTYFPAALKMQAKDVTIDLVYKGELETALEKITAMLNYLTGADGDGTELLIYNPYTRIGRQGVWFKSMTDPEWARSSCDEVATFSITLRVTDPMTPITLTEITLEPDAPIIKP